MPNYLASADWKKVVKDHQDLRAPGVLLQLDAFAKAEGRKQLLEQVCALNELLDEVKATKSKNAKNKELVAYLDLMTKEANQAIGLLEAQAAKRAKEEEEAAKDDDDDDEKEKDDSEALDVELLNMIKRLKMAKNDAPLRFAVVMKSPKEGALALSKKKISPDQIKEAKADAGGGRIAARGVCFTEDGKSIFEVPKEVPATLAKVVKFYVFRDTGKKIKPIFRVRVDLEDEGDEAEGEDATGGTANQEKGPQVTTGKVAAAVLRQELETIRLRAVQGVDQLAAVLRALPDPRGTQVADIISQLSTNFPAETGPLLAKLDTAVQSGDTTQVQSLRAEIQKSAKRWMTFLQDNADHIRGCEINPLGVTVNISEPIRAALKSIVRITR